MRVTIGIIALLATFACGDQTLGDLPGDSDAGTSEAGMTDSDSGTSDSDTSASGTGTSDPDGDSSSSGGDTGTPELGVVGTRCESAADCLPQLSCFSEFFGERPVCTAACDDGTCDEGSVCVAGLPDYRDGTPPLPGYCMHPCVVDEACAELGSVCDAAPDFKERYCF